MAQYIVVLQIGYIFLCYFIEEEIIYIVSTLFVIAITYSKAKFVFWSIDFTCLFVMGIKLFFPCVDGLTKYCRLIPWRIGLEYSKCLFSCKLLLW